MWKYKPYIIIGLSISFSFSILFDRETLATKEFLSIILTIKNSDNDLFLNNINIFSKTLGLLITLAINNKFTIPDTLLYYILF